MRSGCKMNMKLKLQDQLTKLPETDIKNWEQEREGYLLYKMDEGYLHYKMEMEKTLKGQHFAVRKDGRGSDRRSEDQAPNNQKLKFLKAKLEEDQTSTGKAQGKTRKKKVCDPENDQESEVQRQGGNLPQTPETPEKLFYDLLKNTARHAMQERDSQQPGGGAPRYWPTER